jgi:hypothetical protein
MADRAAKGAGAEPIEIFSFGGEPPDSGTNGAVTQDAGKKSANSSLDWIGSGDAADQYDTQDALFAIALETWSGSSDKTALHKSGDYKKLYSDATEKLELARFDVATLSPERREQWNKYQLDIAMARSTEQRTEIKKQRDQDFPSIAEKLNQASELIARGDQRYFPKQQGDQHAANRAQTPLWDMMLDDSSASPLNGRSNFQNPYLSDPGRKQAGPLTVRYTNGIEGSSNAVSQYSNGAEELLNLRSGKLDRLTLHEPLRDPRLSIRKFESLANGPNSFYGDGSSKLVQKAAIPFFDIKSATRLDSFGSLAHEIQRAIDFPNAEDVLDIRKENLVKELSKAMGRGNDTELHKQLTTDLDTIDATKHITSKQVSKLISETERLIGGEAKINPITERERAVLAAQALRQMADITRVKQGPYPNCNVTTVEKVLNKTQPEVVMKMITDLALTGETYTPKSKHVVVNEESLKITNPESLSYPPTDKNVRTLASQYVHMVALNLRWQTLNDKYGSKLHVEHRKWADVETQKDKEGNKRTDPGKDYLMDHRFTPPRVVYKVTGENGVIATDTTPGFVTYKGDPLLDAELQPTWKTPEKATKMGSSEILDVYEAMSGRSGKGLLWEHDKDVEKIVEGFLWRTTRQKDPRITTYKNTFDIVRLATSAERSGDYPKIMACSGRSGFLRAQLKSEGAEVSDPTSAAGHVVTVNGSQQGRRFDFDNNWDDEFDRLGAKAASASEMVEVGMMPEIRINRADIEKAEQVVAQRQELYKMWCELEKVKPYTRFPTKDELLAFTYALKETLASR